MQQLVDQGVSINFARSIVTVTYPTTAGDTFYRGPVTDDPKSPAVGVYAIWNRLRGDQSPVGGTKVSDDARTIAQFIRLDNRDLGKIVYNAGRYDDAITTITARTADAMKRGDYFEPQQVEPESPLPGIVTDMYRAISQLDGADDYIRSIPRPNFPG